VAGRKNSQLAAAQRVAMKMGRRGEAYRRIGVLEVRLPVDMAILTSGFDEALFKRPHADTPTRRYVSPPAAHFDRNETYACFGDRTEWREDNDGLGQHER
jgi:hypothetical protein